MKFLTFIIAFTMSMVNISVAQQSYINSLQNQLFHAIDQQSFSNADYLYHKYNNLTGSDAYTMGRMAGFLESKGFGFQWDKTRSYQLDYLPMDFIDWNQHYWVKTFEQLESSSDIRKKYKDVDDFYRKNDIDKSRLEQEPIFYPNIQMALLHYHDGIILINAIHGNVEIDYTEDFGEIHYAGGNLIHVRLDEKSIFYNIKHNKGQYKAHKILELEGYAINMPRATNKSFITVSNYINQKTQVSLFDSDGKLIFKDYDQIMISPLSQTILLRKESQDELYDFNLKPIFKSANYIIEVWLKDKPYYIFDDKNFNRYLFDIKGKMLLDAKKYQSIYINQSPYALVQKNYQYGIIDPLTEELSVPFQEEPLEEIIPGFFMYKLGDKYKIIDDRNHSLFIIEAVSIQALNTRGKIYLAIRRANDAVGVYDLLGNEIIPIKYNAVQYLESENNFLIHSGKIQFKMDLNGNVIDK